MICGRPASNKSFKKLFVGGHIGAQETIETAIEIPLWIFLHQKINSKTKQNHFKWFYRATLHDYNRASLNEPRRTTLDEYFHPQEVNGIQQSSYFLLFNHFPFPTFSFFYYLCIRNYSVIINGLLIDIRTTKDLIDKNLWVSK